MKKRTVMARRRSPPQYSSRKNTGSSGQLVEDVEQQRVLRQ
jgi:hypothetical protein